MAKGKEEKTIQYGPTIIVWDGRSGTDKRLFPCLYCGAIAHDTQIHNAHHRSNGG
jgi:hypothetical protein